MELKNLPDLEFVDSDVDTTKAEIITIYEGLTGRTLAKADPVRLFLETLASVIVQLKEKINYTGKQNLLAYAVDNSLDHLGVLVGTDRLTAAAATTTMKITLSAARDQATIIPAGIRVTAGDNVYFAINDPPTIAAGETTTTTAATCTVTGPIGNGYGSGELKIIVDPVPFVASIVNTTTSEGGSGIEENDDYRERIHKAPEKFSTAGSFGAYEYFAKSASSLISDVSVDSSLAGTVEVRPLLTGGIIPEAEILNAVLTILNDRTIRPLTDQVTVLAPTTVNYDIDLTYYIDKADATNASTIQTTVETAIQNYIVWQKTKLGRDINPSELIYGVRAAGAKRVEVTKPVYTAITKAQVAILGANNIVFGGLEDG